MYKSLLANVSVADLLEKAANTADANTTRTLMNLVMQFRKVWFFISVFVFAHLTVVFVGLQSSRIVRARVCQGASLLRTIWAVRPSQSRSGSAPSLLFDSQSYRILHTKTFL